MALIAVAEVLLLAAAALRWVRGARQTRRKKRGKNGAPDEDGGKLPGAERRECGHGGSLGSCAGGPPSSSACRERHDASYIGCGRQGHGSDEPRRLPPWPPAPPKREAIEAM